MTEYMLTTTDNPYDPFTLYDEWYAFDSMAGYNTTALLARIVQTSDELSEADQAQALNNGIDEIVEVNAIGVYRKVSSEVDV